MHCLCPCAVHAPCRYSSAAGGHLNELWVFSMDLMEWIQPDITGGGCCRRIQAYEMNSRVPSEKAGKGIGALAQSPSRCLKGCA
eukprot:scaffold148029_cov18-Tisochrysis_lutea.AAC.1